MTTLANIVVTTSAAQWRRLQTYAVLLASAAVLLTSDTAMAQVTYLPDASVTWLESTYMPTNIAFQLSAGDATCPAGKFITWSSTSKENMQAVHALLLQASVYAQPLYAVYDPATVNNGFMGTNGCALSFIGIKRYPPTIN